METPIRQLTGEICMLSFGAFKAGIVDLGQLAEPGRTARGLEAAIYKTYTYWVLCDQPTDREAAEMELHRLFAMLFDEDHAVYHELFRELVRLTKALGELR